MALTFTKLSAYQKWKVTSPVEPIALGAAVSNQSRAGEGVIIRTQRASFGLRTL